jgi:hypothetical protein
MQPRNITMSTSRAVELRKKIALVQKRISKAIDEKNLMVKELDNIEKLCMHNWSHPRLAKGSRGHTYEKECAICGKVLQSRDVNIKF